MGFAPGFGYGCFSLYIYLVGRNIRRCHCFTDAFRYSCCLGSSAYNSFGCHNAFTNSYKRIERAIIAFVSVIGLSFLYELFLVDIDWGLAARSWVVPSIPEGSMLIIMSVLGAVVMPHNLFLHSEVVQSHEYNKQSDTAIRKLLKYEFYDTLLSMGIGWAINSAMILLAASTFL